MQLKEQIIGSIESGEQNVLAQLPDVNEKQRKIINLVIQLVKKQID